MILRDADAWGAARANAKAARNEAPSESAKQERRDLNRRLAEKLVDGWSAYEYREKLPFCASDGKSGAWIARGNLVNSSSWESGSGSVKYSASYTIDPTSRPPQHFELAPGESKKVRITFKIPPGQYQFMVGYGGGVHEEKSVVSNAISFDLNDADVATLAKPELSSAR